MIQPGLQRISRLLEMTPFTWRAIHVAGTNGKGSICAYISAMLNVYNQSKVRADSGWPVVRHGRFTSPHLIDRWDCITIDQKSVQESVFKEVEKDALERNRRDRINASEFELLTATAFEIFNREQVDVGVVEVGMGGRLDATNVLGTSCDSRSKVLAPSRPAPLVTAFARIGLDHQDFLGSTLDAIAREKSGIVKPKVPVVCDGANDPEVVKVLREAAATNDCPISRAIDPLNPSDGYPIDNLVNPGDYYLKNIVDLTGPQHYRMNLAVAFLSTWTALMQMFHVRGSNLSDPFWWGYPPVEELSRTMLQAASKVSFPGRQQHVSIEKLTGRKDEVVLDGAHNADSALALKSFLKSVRVGPNARRQITWVIAMSSTKNAKDILSPLLENGDVVFAVEFGPVDGMPWVKPYPAAQLATAAKGVVPLASSLRVHEYGTNVLAALKAASRQAQGGPLVIAGSLYLVGDVLRLLRDA